MKQKLLERFLRYVKIDTRAKDDVAVFPSTKKQFDLAKLLVRELKELGLKNAAVDKNCYVMRSAPGEHKNKSAENRAYRAPRHLSGSVGHRCPTPGNQELSRQRLLF